MVAASRQQTSNSAQAGMASSPLGEMAGFLSLDSSETPAYVGSSSGLALAVNLGEMVRATVMTKAFPDSAISVSGDRNSSKTATTQNLGRDGGGSGKSNTNPSYKAISLAELLKHRADPPNDEMGLRIINAYLGRVHNKYPFLDRDELWKLHRARWQLEKIKPEDLTQTERFGIFKLYIVYAIASTMMVLSEKYDYTPPEVSFPARHYSKNEKAQ